MVFLILQLEKYGQLMIELIHQTPVWLTANIVLFFLLSDIIFQGQSNQFLFRNLDFHPGLSTLFLF